jgi:hypothetical protein
VDDRRGGALLISLLALSALSILGTALVMSTVADRQVSKFERDSADALAAAESGIAIAKRAIQDMTLTFDDFDSDGQPDFAMADTLPWGATYRLIGEAGEMRTPDLQAYATDGFTIACEGRARGAVRRVRAQMAHDTFLKYARFVQQTGTSYACRALLTGEIYLGGDLDIPTCPAGDEATFLEYVATAGDIPNAAAGIFMRGYVTDAPPIDLENSVDFNEMRDMARGIAAENDCDDVGNVGLYTNLSGGSDPIGIGSTGGVLVLHAFDFKDGTTSPPDTIISYNGDPVENTLTGLPLRAEDFNGIIFFEGDAHVKGVADGVSARCMSIFATDDVFADSSVVTGHTGFDPITRLPDGTGDPVNVGLIGSDYFYLGPCPRIVQVDAAIMAVHANWRAYDSSTGAHPLPPGPVDLDMDGVIETPINHDPDPGTGWDEVNLTNDHWVLNINGPIITYNGGSAAPWSNSAIVDAADGPTRRYNYDMDMSEYPPPCYPVPLNLWVDVSWTEILETESALEDNLP